MKNIDPNSLITLSKVFNELSNAEAAALLAVMAVALRAPRPRSLHGSWHRAAWVGTSHQRRSDHFLVRAGSRIQELTAVEPYRRNQHKLLASESVL